jgi:hypothetical protein
MIVKITPPEVMVEAIKRHGEAIRSAEALAHQAASMLKQGHEQLWKLIREEYPEIGDGVDASCNHKNGTITVTGGLAAGRLLDRLKTLEDHPEISVTKIKME